MNIALQMKNLSIIIVNWNVCGLLKECLDSIKKNQPLFVYETIVIDNASEDESLDTIKNDYPEVRVIKNQVNIGFAAANNQGAQLATGHYLLFLNPDTRVHTGTLDGAVAFMEQHPEAGIMGCRTVNPDGSLQATAFAFPGKLRIFAYVSGLNRVFKISHFTDHSALCTPDYVQGSFLVINKELFDTCGRFDERFFLYAEEVDLCLRVKAAGFKIYYFPAVSITHHGGGSSKNLLAGLGHYIRSIIGLYQKYRSAREVKKLRRILRFALCFCYFSESLFSPWRFRSKKKAFADLRRYLSAVKDKNQLENES